MGGRSVISSTLSFHKRFLIRIITSCCNLIFPILANSVTFLLYSEGCEDRYVPKNEEGHRRCELVSARIEVNGHNVSLNRRGFNAAIIDYESGKYSYNDFLFISSKSFASEPTTKQFI